VEAAYALTRIQATTATPPKNMIPRLTQLPYESEGLSDENVHFHLLDPDQLRPLPDNHELKLRFNNARLEASGLPPAPICLATDGSAGDRPSGAAVISWGRNPTFPVAVRSRAVTRPNVQQAWGACVCSKSSFRSTARQKSIAPNG
jgi:hypothetical protein